MLLATLAFEQNTLYFTCQDDDSVAGPDTLYKYLHRYIEAPIYLGSGSGMAQPMAQGMDSVI